MSHEQIIRAWKDSSYRDSLSAEELALVPANPAGVVLTENELESVVGQVALSQSHALICDSNILVLYGISATNHSSNSISISFSANN